VHPSIEEPRRGQRSKQSTPSAPPNENSQSAAVGIVHYPRCVNLRTVGRMVIALQRRA